MKGEFTMNINQSQALSVVLNILLSTLSFIYDVFFITLAVTTITVVLYGSFTGAIVPY